MGYFSASSMLPTHSKLRVMQISHIFTDIVVVAVVDTNYCVYNACGVMCTFTFKTNRIG